MKIDTGLFQQQELKLTMTQELSQAITLLQYPVIELAQFIENKALENPLIDIQYGELPGKKYRAPKDDSWIEQIGEETRSLETYLKGQIPFHILNDTEEALLKYLIANLDENGYLMITFEETERVMPVNEQDWECMVDILQTFEPVGVGATSLAECLLIQHQRRGARQPLTEEILSAHFELFFERKWKEIAKKLGVSLKEIQDVADYIQTFNPKPGAVFQFDEPPYTVPDVKIDVIKGEIKVHVPDAKSFNITLNQEYSSLLRHQGDEATTNYLKEKISEFRWIERAIAQRHETLAKITSAIAHKQAAYFLTGKKEHRKPMTMKEIADMLEIHESTVSRTVRDKYAQTPYGTFELKSFFSSSIQTNQADETSAERVREEISRLVDEEQKVSPLSDQAIAQALFDTYGIRIARRTIAKYREQLNIPPSSKRRRYK